MADETDVKEGAKKASDSLRLRISKMTYIFDVKKKYNLTKNFILKRRPDRPEDNIKERILEALGKKREIEEEPKKKEKEEEPAKKEQYKVPFLEIAIFVTLLMLGGGALFLVSKLAFVPPPREPFPAPVVFTGDFNFAVRESGVISSPNDPTGKSRAYFLTRYYSKNISEMNFTLNLFSQRPPNQVFLLQYKRESADSYPLFRNALFARLKEEGIPINEIGIDSLWQLPPGAVLIVPTGLMPMELLGENNYFSYKSLLENGVDIVYIGAPFDRTVIDNDGMTRSVFHTDVTFSKGGVFSTEGFGLYDPQYAASPGQGSELAGGGRIYGSVSLIKYKQGTLIIVPQSLDGGWRGDGEAAAKDIARLVREKRWITPLARATHTTNRTGEWLTTIFTGDFPASNAFVEIAVSASDLNGNTKRVVELLEVQKEQRGDLAPESEYVSPYYLSGARERIRIYLKEESPRLVKLYVKFYKNGRLMQEEELELGLSNPTIEKTKDMQVNVEPGAYIVRVEDGAGKVYAAGMVRVIGLEVSLESKDWKKGEFTFGFSSAGQPVLPKTLSITMDGKNEQKYNPTSFRIERGKSIVDYSYPAKIEGGKHTFRFSSGDWSAEITENYRLPKQMWEDPLVLILGFLSLVITGIGFLMRRQETVKYGLDIPDFPPVSTIKIPVKRETVMEVFENVNTSFSWRWMPLRLEEIKAGFRQLTYNGKPIMIGDFNLERILVKMQSEGLVEENIGYWGLKSWEKSSGHNLLYLTIYRILRNVFVNNAVRFSKLDAMPDCDVKVYAGKEELYFHIMDETDPERVVHRALATAKLGTTIIVFKDEATRDKFRESLVSLSKLAVALKVMINNNKILLLPVKNAVSAHLKTIVK
ncbi:MAG: hypothetical protein N3G22_04455 [Candidatus Micrarchaeota archaeon]|nr:hypothetical protein [Candidatus Micrarchaeota archaeon]